MKKSNILAFAALAGMMSVSARAEGNLTPAYIAGTIIIYGYQDPATCLVWAQPTSTNLAPALRYQASPGYPSGSTWYNGRVIGGKTGWRLPTEPEWRSFYSSLVYIRALPAAQRPVGFVEPTKAPYWTSTVVSANVAALDTRTGYTQIYALDGAAAPGWGVLDAACPGYYISPFSTN